MANVGFWEKRGRERPGWRATGMEKGSGWEVGEKESAGFGLIWRVEVLG